MPPRNGSTRTARTRAQARSKPVPLAQTRPPMGPPAKRAKASSGRAVSTSAQSSQPRAKASTRIKAPAIETSDEEDESEDDDVPSRTSSSQKKLYRSQVAANAAYQETLQNQLFNSDYEEPPHDDDHDGDHNPDLLGLDGDGVKDILSLEQPSFNAEDDNDEELPRGTKLKAANKRALDRRAEAPQWSEPQGGKRKRASTDDILSSDEEDASPPPPSSSVGTELTDDELDTDDDNHRTGGKVQRSFNAGWPAEAWLQLPGPGTRNLSLKDQNGPVMHTIQVALPRCIGHVVAKDAFPSELLKLVRRILRGTARDLKYHALADRFTLDVKFSNYIARLITQRISNFRGQLKKDIVQRLTPFYQLFGTPEKIADTVKDELDGSKFLFPKTNGLPTRTRPFLHPCIIESLRQLLFVSARGLSLVDRYSDELIALKEKYAKGNKSEFLMPAPVLCLVATAIQSALDDWRSGRHKPTEFNADQYTNAYRSHIQFLEDIKYGSESKYARLLKTIYSECCDGLESAGQAAPNAAKEIVDIGAMESDDDTDDDIAPVAQSSPQMDI
ncbi:hypothetical protein CC2G_013957 [Coprinopsis cinerea AmutBmut pab1-1]|nr:hypothetical protein CC2G_013957 [Coprinopsis cinerea AmutBmut pab1-1]